MGIYHTIKTYFPKHLSGKGGIFYDIILCIVVFLAFYPSLTNDFQLQWDDQWMVLQHPIILDHSLDNLWYYFTHFDRGQGIFHWKMIV